MDKEIYDLETYWQWEAKINEQEVDYYEQLLRDLKSQIDAEIVDRLMDANLEDIDVYSNKKLNSKEKQAKQIIDSVEDKYAQKKLLLCQ